jgi:hypothetical protein
MNEPHSYLMSSYVAQNPPSSSQLAWQFLNSFTERRKTQRERNTAAILDLCNKEIGRNYHTTAASEGVFQYTIYPMI